MQERSPAEVSEIEKHKYFMSEKAGHDVGWDAAELDWDQSYGKAFRASAATTPRPSFLRSVLQMVGMA